MWLRNIEREAGAFVSVLKERQERELKCCLIIGSKRSRVGCPKGVETEGQLNFSSSVFTMSGWASIGRCIQHLVRGSNTVLHFIFFFFLYACCGFVGLDVPRPLWRK